MPNKISLIPLSLFNQYTHTHTLSNLQQFLSLKQTCFSSTRLSPCNGFISVDKALQSPHVLALPNWPMWTNLASNYQASFHASDFFSVVFLPVDNFLPSQGFTSCRNFTEPYE